MCVCVRVRVLVDSYLCECADVCFAGPQIDLFFFFTNGPVVSELWLESERSQPHFVYVRGFEMTTCVLLSQAWSNRSDNIELFRV